MAMFLRIPKVRPHERARALKVHRVHLAYYDAAGWFALHDERIQQRRLGAEVSVTIHPQRDSDARDQKQECDSRIADDVPQRVRAVVAASVWHEQGPLVQDADEAWQVTARRAVQSFRATGGQQSEG